MIKEVRTVSTEPEHSTSTMSTDPTPEATLATANFIRDLYYNPVLRNKYWTAVGKATDTLREKALNKLFIDYGYNCTFKDFSSGSGWKTLTEQSLLAWNSIYRLSPVNDSVGVGGDKAGQVYTCMVSGSRTKSVTILWDNVPIIGVDSSKFPVRLVVVPKWRTFDP